MKKYKNIIGSCFLVLFILVLIPAGYITKLELPENNIVSTVMGILFIFYIYLFMSMLMAFICKPKKAFTASIINIIVLNLYWMILIAVAINYIQSQMRYFDVGAFARGLLTSETSSNIYVPVVIWVTCSITIIVCSIMGKHSLKDEDSIPVIQTNKAVKVCPQCGHILKDDQMFCTKCGTPYQEDIVETKEDESLNKRVCKKCGNILKDDQMFCTKCGTPYQEDVAEIKEAQPTIEELPILPKKRVCSKCGATLNDDQVFCIQCGTQYEEHRESLVCPHCGQHLQESDLFCTACGTPVEKKKSKKVCPQCGKEVDNDKEFCPYCGVRL